MNTNEDNHKYRNEWTEYLQEANNIIKKNFKMDNELNFKCIIISIYGSIYINGAY